LSEAQVHASLSNALATALATSGIAINNANTDLRDGQIVITFDARYNDINGRGEIYASLGVRDGALTASVTRITVNGNNVDANTLSRINQQITAAVQQLTAQGGDGSSFTVKSVRIANNNVEIVITVRS
jgi:hypothetical protein